jgi:hypothetical protein
MSTSPTTKIIGSMNKLGSLSHRELIITPLLSETAKPWYIEVDRQSQSFVSGDYLLFDKLSNFLKFSFLPLFNLHHFNNESELYTDISTKTDFKFFAFKSISNSADSEKHMIAWQRCKKYLTCCHAITCF